MPAKKLAFGSARLRRTMALKPLFLQCLAPTGPRIRGGDTETRAVAAAAFSHRRFERFQRFAMTFPSHSSLPNKHAMLVYNAGPPRSRPVNSKPQVGPFGKKMSNFPKPSLHAPF